MNPNTSNIDFLSDYPVSQMCIANMIDEKFQTEGFSFLKDWNKRVISMIWLAYFGLLIRGIIQIESKRIKTSSLFGLINRDFTRFIPKLTERASQVDKFGWIETQIISSINNCQPQGEGDILKLLQLQARFIVNELLGEGEEFIAPEKKIIERAILYDKHNLWDNSYETSLLGLKRTIELKIDSATRDKLVNYLSRVESLEKEFIESNFEVRKFKDWIKYTIELEINLRNIRKNKD